MVDFANDEKIFSITISEKFLKMFRKVCFVEG
jgi:hypothetical protein